MTNRTIPQGAREGFAADQQHQEEQGRRAGILLRHAADAAEAQRANEAPAERAQRLRGAAVLAQTAALELAVTCGWSEAAASAKASGLFDEVKP
jgi:hypothetical protein